jgi:glyoxylase I family protein
MVLGIDHVSVLVSDLARSLHFYHRLLGLSLQERPNLGFDGAWLAVGQTQSIHLLCLPNPDAHRVAPIHVGRDRHLALGVTTTEVIKQRLIAENIPFTPSQSGRDALFCRDPDGNGIELVTIEVKPLSS